MSAIGSYVVLRRQVLATCIERANEIRTESTGRWIFRRMKSVGMEEFTNAWASAIVETVSFEHSGNALGYYLDAQEDINRVEHSVDETPAARAISKAFPHAFLFETRRRFAELPPDRLAAWCREEYGEEGQDLLPAVQAAHRFFAEGLARVDEENAVAFIIG
jgi:hypothetical protein